MDKSFIPIWLLMCVSFSVGIIDPCDPLHHRNIHKPGFRGTECDSLGKNICDKYMGDGWFIAQNFDETQPRKLATNCIHNFRCGTQYPIWMNGSHPTVREGIVDRVACMTGKHTCCDKQYNIKVTNCSKFFVYYLNETDSCSQAYCFGPGLLCKELDPCMDGYHSELPEDESRASSCKGRSNELCDNKLTDGWYRVKGNANVSIPTSCVETHSCGTKHPIWLNGSYPSLQEIMVERKACVSGRSCCQKSYPIKLRNCTSFMVYKMTKTTQCPERYCFGEKGGCRNVADSERSLQKKSNCSTECYVIIGAVVPCVGIVFAMFLFKILKWHKRKVSDSSNSIDGQILQEKGRGKIF